MYIYIYIYIYLYIYIYISRNYSLYHCCIIVSFYMILLFIAFYKWKFFSMVSSLFFLFNRSMMFRLKNGSSRQLSLIPQSYT